MIAHFVNAVIRHISYGYAQLSGNVNRDVVHSHSIPADDAATLRSLNDPGRNLGEARHDAVAVGSQRNQSIL